MLSFLPQTYKKRLLIKYWFKFLTAVFLFVSLTFIIALVGLLPSYLNEKAQVDAFRSQLEQESSPEERAMFLRNEANKIYSDYLVKEIKSLTSKKKPSEIIDLIVNMKPEAISLHSVRFGEKSIGLTGVSSTRTELINFQKILQENPLFSEVNLPFSDITKNVDAPFTIDITLK